MSFIFFPFLFENLVWKKRGRETINLKAFCDVDRKNSF
ncbi:hypothetical protein H733_1453 [Haemophilus influenzae CGSHiCZ412602]|nr:hypothetical protein H733_1453 [Haemophilus influenzae CGSHiCZ412602]